LPFARVAARVDDRAEPIESEVICWMGLRIDPKPIRLGVEDLLEHPRPWW